MTKAMVLAAGLGTRMRPLTDHLPKPLIKVAGISLLDRALDWLDASGVNEVVVNSHYKADMLADHLATRQKPVIRISHEPSVLETGGGILKALPLLGDAPFFAINGDVICLNGKTPALQRLLQHWRDADMDALLLLHPVDRAVGYDGAGDFRFNPDGTLRRRMHDTSAPFVFTGVQLVHPRLFANAPEGAFSMNRLYNRNITPDGTLQRIAAVIHDGHWLHVGDPQGLQAAETFLHSLKDQ